jgi:DNA-binding NtrC family response regulator
MAAGPYLTPDDLPQEIITQAFARRLDNSPDKGGTAVMRQMESRYDSYKQELVQTLMERHHGNKSKVASELGIARTTLYRLLARTPNSETSHPQAADNNFQPNFNPLRNN